MLVGVRKIAMSLLMDVLLGRCAACNRCRRSEMAATAQQIGGHVQMAMIVAVRKRCCGFHAVLDGVQIIIVGQR